MKHLLFIFGLATLLLACGRAKTTANDLAISNPIKTSIKISEVKDDKVPVIINPGRFTQDKAIYRLPRVIPGTYSLSDFGLFIDDFVALDYDGKEMNFTIIYINSLKYRNEYILF